MAQNKSTVKSLFINYLSEFRFFRNYAYKFYVITLVGILTPVLSAFLIWFFIDINASNEVPIYIGIILITLICMILIIHVQIKLVEPLLYSDPSFEEFIKNRDRLKLPKKLDNNIE